MAEKKVLIVDDEENIRLLYKDAFEEDGYVVALSDGSEPILDVLKREDPDVVILDIRLNQKLTGLDLLQDIRSTNTTLPVILSTAYDSFQHDMKSIAADHYVVKSVDLTELKAKVASFFE
ncbi:response regulator [Halodesulfovibrio spirochaetisodalis]|uniref:Chemotaxis protein CheY n=1 Tax=Halodesulfovibrio spirochaetisodalis TaxID=1560234 RepID=A0A1B7XAI1_9BACT|nr:response regulator [Halodesulfovibrio spirochaetisodalis]OBQ46352.1 chemotaxis protein CheY [Halodesulfovibrio spirochaetisodalis]